MPKIEIHLKIPFHVTCLQCDKKMKVIKGILTCPQCGFKIKVFTQQEAQTPQGAPQLTAKKAKFERPAPIT